MSIFDVFLKKNKEEQRSPTELLAPVKTSFWAKFNKAILGKTFIDETVIDALEEMLLSADVGIPTTLKLIEQLEKQVARNKYLKPQELQEILRSTIVQLLTIPSQKTAVKTSKPYILLVVGVNGVGKTTTIGKLAAHYKAQGATVIVGAADTFRAGANQQLQRWSTQVGVHMVGSPQHTDPSAVAYETIQKAIDIQADIVIIDTAGRLHTNTNLMQELSKVRRTLTKKNPEAPHEVLLVLDATTGQNALTQTKAFTEATAVTGLIITKLDGTAKGGIIIGIAEQFQLPIKYIGVGEKAEDLLPFNAKNFAEALFKQPEGAIENE
jgi:fused signal recognition particle receptor